MYGKPFRSGGENGGGDGCAIVITIDDGRRLVVVLARESRVERSSITESSGTERDEGGMGKERQKFKTSQPASKP
jgi:hypothetical protein